MLVRIRQKTFTCKKIIKSWSPLIELSRIFVETESLQNSQYLEQEIEYHFFR